MDQQNFSHSMPLDILDHDTRYVNLGQVYRNQTMGENFWVDVFAGMAKELMDVTSDMAEDLDGEDVVALLQNEYRFDPLLGLSATLEKPHMVPFIGKTVMINGIECPGIGDISSNLDRVLVREKLLDPAPYTKIPGNLSIDNMEFDQEERSVHLLGRKRLRPYGDLKHDLARFAFSLEGGFPSLRMKLDGMSGLKVSGLEGNQQQMVKSMFKRWLQRLNPELGRQIPLIIALDCFATIHSGSFAPLEQQAILARGIVGIQEYIHRGYGF